MGTLVELQREGKIRHIGLSNVNLRQLQQARILARVVSVQNRYNLTDRTYDGIVDACVRDGLAFLPWYPLSAGALANSQSKLSAIARRYHATPSQIALAWLLHRSPVMLPIPGTSSTEHFEENLAAKNLRLTEEDYVSLTKS
jgi:pyridoxine 4-dehydrogenase